MHCIRYYGVEIKLKNCPLLASTLMLTMLFDPLTVIPLVTGDHMTGGVRLAVWFRTKTVAFVGQETKMVEKLANICTPGAMMLAVRLVGCASAKLAALAPLRVNPLMVTEMPFPTPALAKVAR